MIDRAALAPGDVIVTGTPDWAGWFIRLRSKLQRRPALHNHVALFTHVDADGWPRGLEGRPGGFGWANLDRYLDRSDTIANVGQPGRSDADRARVVEMATAMVGRPYDWHAIVAMAAELAGPHLVRLIEHRTGWADGTPPAQVVCSSSVRWLYGAVGWDGPGPPAAARWTDPDDWTNWINSHGWDKPANPGRSAP